MPNQPETPLRLHVRTSLTICSTVLLLLGMSGSAMPSVCQPQILLGGYMDTRVTSAQGGEVVWLGVAPADQPELNLEMFLQGVPLGLSVPLVDAESGLYQFSTTLGPGAGSGRHLLGVGTLGKSLWPYLTVTDAPIIQPPEEPWFRNVAEEVGLKAGGYASGRLAFYDIDGDGWLDVLQDRTKVLLNREDGLGGRAFVDFTAEAGLVVTDGQGNQRVPTVVVLADVDNDGDLDAYSGMYLDFLRSDETQRTPDLGFRSAIFLNDGTGRFSILPNSGVENFPATEVPAGFFDSDKDGCLDLLVGAFYTDYGESLSAYPPRLYKGNCDGTFTDVTEASGMLLRPSAIVSNGVRPLYGLTHTDWNNDGWQDVLWCAYGRRANVLFRNNGNGTYTDVGGVTTFDGDDKRTDANEPTYRRHGNSFAAQAADYDNDGDMDVILAEITHSWAGESSDLSMVLTNLGADQGYRFQREFRGTDRQHLTSNWNQGDIHAGWMDADGDGRQDLLIASGDYPDGQFLRIWRNVPLGPAGQVNWFVDSTTAAGFGWESCAAISVGDYDRDGAPDLLAGRSLMRMPADKVAAWGPHGALFRNEAARRHSWLTLRLEGLGQGHSNREGIGARVTVRTCYGLQVREVNGAAGHAGQMNARELYFGLGAATQVLEVTVEWPDRARTRQSYSGMAVNRHYLLREGQEAALDVTP